MINNQERIHWMQEQLQAALKPTFLQIQDDSAKHAGHEEAKGGAGHFSVTISSPSFKNKTLIECHRMVYEAVAERMPHDIHALKIKIKS